MISELKLMRSFPGPHEMLIVYNWQWSCKWSTYKLSRKVVLTSNQGPQAAADFNSSLKVRSTGDALIWK